jgi:hypothetical protein
MIRGIAVAVSVGIFVILFAFALIAPTYGIAGDYEIPILNIPLSVILWSALGSITSILYRFNRGADREIQNPIRWLITRPLTGVLLGALAYLAIKVGFVAATEGEVILGEAANEMIWLISFLVGFSDKFSDSILKNLIGKFGGDE